MCHRGLAENNLKVQAGCRWMKAEQAQRAQLLPSVHCQTKALLFPSMGTVLVSAVCSCAWALEYLGAQIRPHVGSACSPPAERILSAQGTNL